MQFRLFLFALAAFGTAGTAAMAQPGAGGMGDRLMEMDTNGDGAISMAEARTAREAMFARLDANHDGFISADERPEGADMRGGRMLERADTDSDGRISRAELMGQPYMMFQRLDANNDGVLSREELSAVRARMGQ